MMKTIFCILLLCASTYSAYTTNQPSGRFRDSLKVDSLRNSVAIGTDANGKFIKSDSVRASLKSDTALNLKTTGDSLILFSDNGVAKSSAVKYVKHDSSVIFPTYIALKRNSATLTAPESTTIIQNSDEHGVTAVTLVAPDGAKKFIADGTLRVYNPGNLPIPSGRAVCIVGHLGNVPSVRQAIASNDTLSVAVGLTMAQIASKAFGRIQTDGMLLGHDYASLDSGKMVFLSPTDSGQFVVSIPMPPYYCTKIGYTTGGMSVGSAAIVISIEMPILYGLTDLANHVKHGIEPLHFGVAKDSIHFKSIEAHADTVYGDAFFPRNFYLGDTNSSGIMYYSGALGRINDVGYDSNAILFGLSGTTRGPRALMFGDEFWAYPGYLTLSSGVNGGINIGSTKKGITLEAQQQGRVIVSAGAGTVFLEGNKSSLPVGDTSELPDSSLLVIVYDSLAQIRTNDVVLELSAQNPDSGVVIDGINTTVNGNLVLNKAKTVSSVSAIAGFGTGSDSNAVKKVDLGSVFNVFGVQVHGGGITIGSTPDSTNYDSLGIRSKNWRVTPEGGYAIKLINRTGATSIKGYLVSASPYRDTACTLTVAGNPNCIGVFYESGIANGSSSWIVINGIASVYFSGTVDRGKIARSGMSDDLGYSSGMAVADVPSLTAYKIGVAIEARTGAGLSRCILK